MPSLYEIAVEGDAVERLLLESEGELTPELEDRLDHLLRCGKDKLDNAAAPCAASELRTSSRILKVTHASCG